MNERIRNLLNCFEPSMQKELLDFCVRISKIQADVFILMARKASCFFNCLEELGLVHFNGYVTSERILDMNCEWLLGKSIIIIDDAIVSGTSINRTIDKLNKAGVASIEVHVLTVNSKWFQEDMLLNEKGLSYLYPKCNVETNEKCIELCYNVVKSILLQPRPYDIDFPYYNRVEIKANKIEYLFNRAGWDWYEISSVEQKENNIFTFTIIPTHTILNSFQKNINFNFSKNCLVKLRIYGTYKDKNKKTYSLRIVPMIVFDRISVKEIESVFDELVEKVSRKERIVKNAFCTVTSKLRLLQFYFSNQLAHFWVKDLPKCLEISKEDLIFEDRNLSFIFPEDIDREVTSLCGKEVRLNYMHGEEKVEIKDRNVSDYIEDIDYMSIESILIEPFIDKYYKKEIPCRELVLREGRKVYNNSQYDELLQRLNSGITFHDMVDRLKNVKEHYDVATRVSLFIDRAVDMGMIVPITQLCGEYVSRAYRHGEDVLFGKREEILYLKLLYEFQMQSRNGEGITHISTEKMIVLFSKIGVKRNILQPYVTNFTTNPKDNNGEINRVLRTKTYLKGPVALVADVNTHKKTKEKPYITEESKSIWFTNIFQRKRYINTDQQGLYHIQKIDTSSITTNDLNEVENIAILFGNLCNKEIDTGINFGDDELTKISTCLCMEDVVRAIAAEIYIFSKEWEYISLTKNKESDERMLNERKRSKIYEALNSAQMKMLSYETGEAIDLIKKVKFAGRVEQNLWESWFKDVLNKQSVDEQLNQIVMELFFESKYIIMASLYAYQLLIMMQFIDFKFYSKSKKYAYFEDCYKKLDDYEKILEGLESPETFNKELNWEKLKKIKKMVIETCLEKDTIMKVKREIENDWLKDVINYIEILINEANHYLENVCCIVGESGKILKMNTYNHVLAIPFYYRSEEEQDYVYDTIHYCYNHMLVKKAESNTESHYEEGQKIEYISPKDKPDIELGENVDVVWFAARGKGADVLLTKMALNIFHKLNRGVLFKEIYLGDISYKYSIKKTENHMSEFICNSFYRLIEEIPASIFQLKNSVPEILVMLEKNIYSRNKFIQFVNNDKKALELYTKRNQHEIEAVNSKYVVDYYVYNPKINKNDEERNMNKRDIGIITILSEEAKAVIDILELKEEKFKLGQRLYYSGYLQGEEVNHSVVMTQQFSQGEISIVSAYNDMVNRYNPDVIFLVGIAGGITKNVDYCSVVLGRQIISYDLMKDTEEEIQRRGDVNKVNSVFLPLYQRLLNRQQITAAQGSKNESIHLIESNIASGSAVIANELSEITKWIHNYNDKTDAVEMEAYGLTTAFYEDQSDKHPKYGVCVIRGISDMADNKKSKIKQYRVPAAENAAIVVKELIKLIPKL